MSTDSSGSAPQKKLTTAEILAKARADKAAKAAAEAAPVAEVAAPIASPASEVPAATTESPVAAAKPKSTADILAAARANAAAKAAGTASAPVAGSETGAKPKSTADILAAARATAAAKAAGGEVSAAAPATAAKPAAAKPIVAAGGPKPSVQEMLAAVRGATPTAIAVKAESAAGPKAVAPPMPARPAAPAPKKAVVADTRRSFLVTATVTCLSPFWVAWASFAAATAASTLACLRFMLPNVLTEPPSKFKVGPPGDYDLGTVSEKFKAQFGIWVVHTDKYQGKNLVYALSTVCTHLGCTPSWLDGEQKYKCPCHGSGFYINGINFEGPAPRPLERVGIRLAEDGMLEVDKSLKFQEEMGQWNDPASYVEIG